MPFSAIMAKGSSSFSSRSSSFSSSSRSSSSGFSSNRSSSSSSSSSKPSFSSSSGSSSGKSSYSNSKPKSSFDYAQQRQSLTPPKPKNDYVNDFKAKNAAKFPTTFETKPATRPSYIPPTATYNGQSRSIDYNPQTRSYGFFDDLGKFMVYDAITDLALKSFDNDEKIYVQNVSNLKEMELAAQQEEESTSPFAIFLLIFVGGIGILFFLGWLANQ